PLDPGPELGMVVGAEVESVREPMLQVAARRGGVAAQVEAGVEAAHELEHPVLERMEELGDAGRIHRPPYPGAPSPRPPSGRYRAASRSGRRSGRYQARKSKPRRRPGERMRSRQRGHPSSKLRNPSRRTISR